MIDGRAIGWALTLVGLLALLGATGCKSRPPECPRQTLQRYLEAVRQNNPKAAYELLGKETRERVTLEEFQRRWGSAGGELKEQANNIERSLKKSAKITARFSSAKGKTRLAYDSAGWRITGGIELGGGGATPRETVLALVKAAERRDYLAIKRLVSKAVAHAFEQEIEKRIDKIKKALKKTRIKIFDKRASLRYRGYKLEIVKEDGQWRVADFD